jgi:hypothetical protein
MVLRFLMESVSSRTEDRIFTEDILIDDLLKSSKHHNFPHFAGLFKNVKWQNYLNQRYWMMPVIIPFPFKFRLNFFLWLMRKEFNVIIHFLWILCNLV